MGRRRPSRRRKRALCETCLDVLEAHGGRKVNCGEFPSRSSQTVPVAARIAPNGPASMTRADIHVDSSARPILIMEAAIVPSSVRIYTQPSVGLPAPLTPHSLFSNTHHQPYNTKNSYIINARLPVWERIGWLIGWVRLYIDVRVRPP